MYMQKTTQVLGESSSSSFGPVAEEEAEGGGGIRQSYNVRTAHAREARVAWLRLADEAMERCARPLPGYLVAFAFGAQHRLWCASVELLHDIGACVIEARDAPMGFPRSVRVIDPAAFLGSTVAPLFDGLAPGPKRLCRLHRVWCENIGWLIQHGETRAPLLPMRGLIAAGTRFARLPARGPARDEVLRLVRESKYSSVARWGAFVPHPTASKQPESAGDEPTD